MKCDHIRTRKQGDTPFFPSMLNNGSVEVCLKEDVDAAIDELKTEHHKERDEYISMVHSREQTIKELKQKLESVQASMYCDVVDANMKIRRLQRALYKALANCAKCEERINNMDAYEASKYLPSAEDKFRKKAERWSEMERKCRAKADEFGG